MIDSSSMYCFSVPLSSRSRVILSSQRLWPSSCRSCRRLHRVTSLIANPLSSQAPTFRISGALHDRKMRYSTLRMSIAPWYWSADISRVHFSRTARAHLICTAPKPAAMFYPANSEPASNSARRAQVDSAGTIRNRHGFVECYESIERYLRLMDLRELFWSTRVCKLSRRC